MRRVAATVTVVTVRMGDELVGTTATAMCSLSADPPSLLVCLNHSATLFAAMRECAFFSVNVLHASQAGIAEVFADRERRKTGFAEGWALHPDAPPRLPNSQASFLCRRAAAHQFGTHTIFVGAIEEVSLREEVTPLLYLDGEYLAAR